MPGTPTPNYGLYIGTVSGDVGVWGGDVNTNLTTFVDSFLGNELGVAITGSDVTLTQSQWQNYGIFKLTGALSGNRNLILPFNLSTGAGLAVGGKFIVDNQCSQNFTVTVKTVAAGSTGVVVPQGARTSLFSDQTNVLYADDARTAKLTPNAGNPNGAVTGNSGNALTGQGADILWDTTDQTLFVSVGSGVAPSSGTVWTAIGQNLPTPQGYLTPTSGVPIITGDVIGTGGMSIYYTPYKGNLIPIYNGSAFVTQVFQELTLVLNASSQAAAGIFDVFVFLNSGVVTVGFGPSWLGGAVGGSVTAGSCARGTGAGSSALQRINGILTNANSMTANNGGSTYSVPANQGTYVGSVYIDNSTAGSVSSYLTGACGQAGGTGTTGNRNLTNGSKRGIWNAYNRVPLKILCWDAFISGSNPFFSQNTGGVGAWAQYNIVANATAFDQLVTFTGLAEEAIEIDYKQLAELLNGNGPLVGIGLNSTSVPSGFGQSFSFPSAFGSVATLFNPKLIIQPVLGINNIFPIVSTQGNQNQRFFSTSANMLLSASYMG